MNETIFKSNFKLSFLANLSNFKRFLVIKIDDYMGGWNNYDDNVSDHRPVGIKLDFNSLNFNPESLHYEKRVINVVNTLGAKLNCNHSGLIIQLFNDGSAEKKYILK